MLGLESLAAWRRRHGFAVIRGVDAEGEIFSVLPAAGGGFLRVPGWRGRSEQSLREHMRAAGRPEAEIDAALTLARRWTTTITRSDA
ncbi:MAG: hypothetical protein QM736_03660 [Vicinamibacterales bacterium]